MKMNFLKLTLVMLLSITINAQQRIYQSESKSTSLRCRGLEKIKSNTLISEINDDWVVIDGKISIIAIPKPNKSKGLEQELLTLGLHDHFVRKNGIITGYLSVNNINLLENCIYLRSVMPTMRNKTSLGLTTSQAGQAFFSDHISEKLGLTGEGIKIGIISDSYNQRGGAPEGVINGDLPGEDNPNGFNKEVVILSDNFSSGIDEGRAMAELIHDIAPGAELFFHSGINGQQNLEQAILNLAAADCDIIVDDLFSNTSPFYQDGFVAQAIDKVAAQGVSYFTAAGNFGSLGLETEYDFELVDLGDRIAEQFKFQSGLTTRSFLLTRGLNVTVDVIWDDFTVFGNSENLMFSETDFDVFLVNAENGDVIVESSNDNTISGVPLERVEYFHLGVDPITVNLIIEKREGTPRPDRIYCSFGGNVFELGSDIEPQLEPNVTTLYGHRAAKGAITLGAMDYRLSPEFGETPLVEDFSSYGGAPITRDINGQKIPLVVRKKPELVAPDGVNTSFFSFFDSDRDGFPNFFGTSAAAPNAAALAALMLEANSNLSNNDIRAILIESALDMDDELTEGFDEGFDFASGYGLIQADKAIALATGEAMVYRVEMVDAETKELINIIEEDEELDLTDVENNVDLRLATTNVSSLNSVLSGGLDNRFISNNSSQAPFFAIDADNSFNREWSATSGDYNLRWFAFSENETEDFSSLNFSVVNSNFDSLSSTVLNIGTSEFNAFPNPALSQDFVRLNLPNANIQSFELFSQSGDLVSSGLGSIVNVGSLPTGIYIVIALDDKGVTHDTKISVQ